MTRIAAVQTCAGDDIARNLDAAAGYVEEAAAGGAQLVALPECFALMAKDKHQLRACAEVFAGDGGGGENGNRGNHGDNNRANTAGTIQHFMRELAVRAGVWLIAGSLPLRSADPERVFNSLLVYDDRGACRARYDKIHLFDMRLELDDGARQEAHHESDYTMPGGACAVVETPAGALGLSVCYDLRFPELYRRLAAMGATVLAVPSAFTVPTGAAHWLALLRARAIENACYVVAPAQVGAHSNGRATYGHSVIIDPWGEALAERAGGPGVIFADIDAKHQQKIRAQLPSLSHRRADLFP